MACLSLQLFGPFQAELDGKPVSGFRSDKIRALLAYLAVEAHRPWSRAILANLLWPDFPEKTAQSNLRNALSNLRRVLEEHSTTTPFLHVTNSTAQFNHTANCWLDVRAFLDLLNGAGQDENPALNESEIDHFERALTLYRGEFLEGFALDSAPFEAWLRATREQLRQQAKHAASQLALAQKQVGDLTAAGTFTQRWLDLEPWEEAAHRLLMEILARRGQRSAALAQFDVCRQQLAQELGVEPEAETVHLYEEIKNGRFTPPALQPQSPTWPGLENRLRGSKADLFVAREDELETLTNALARAAGGEGGVRFVTGEPGSGKTALLAEFARRALAQDAKLLVLWGQCSAFTGQGDPYYPFLNVIRMLLGEAEAPVSAGVSSSPIMQRLWRQLPAALDAVLDHGHQLIDRFFSGQTLLAFAQQHSGVAPDRLKQLETLLPQLATRPPQQRAPQAALFEQFTQVLRALAQNQPLLLIVDDLQWIDPGSVNLLFHLGRQLADSRILLLGAYRPEEITQPRGGEAHPLLNVVGELQRDYGDVYIDLMRSARSVFIDALLDSEPNHLSREFRTLLNRQTFGNPLFAIELLRGMQLRGEIQRDSRGCWVEGPHLDWHKLPARIEAVIARRIGHLSQPCRDVLSVASVEGEQFTAEVAAAVMQQETAQVCSLLSQEACRQHQLVAAQSTLPVGGENLAIYNFRHGLFQIYLYHQLDVVEKARLHGLVGSKLEAFYQPNLARFPEIAHPLARHFARAGLAEKAVAYYTTAGKNALRLSANHEAITHFYSALKLLATLPVTPGRDLQELDLQLSLGPALTAVKGWAPPEMAAAYARAQELCTNIDDSAQLVPALWLLATFRLGRSEHAEVDKLCRRLLRLALQAGDPALMALALLQVSPYYQGKFGLVRPLLEEAGAGPDVALQSRLAQQYGMAPAVVALAYLAECLWLLGLSEEAEQRIQQAHELAEQIQHPMTTCYPLGRSCWLAAMKGDSEAVYTYAEKLYQAARPYGFNNYVLAAGFFLQWVAVMQGAPSNDSLAQMQQAMTTYRATGTLLNHTAFLVLFAQACGVLGEHTRGLAAVNESLTLGEETGELWFQAEAYRVKGTLLRLQAQEQPQPAAAFKAAWTCFEQARQIAEQQGARSFALRALKEMDSSKM
jgi:DNA-binding SARP family transcriptional activator